MHNKQHNWNKFYDSTRAKSVSYPESFVVRMFYGSNPNHMIRNYNTKNKKALDLSAGTGRNINLLLELGFIVDVSEISEKLVSNLKNKYYGSVNAFHIGMLPNLPIRDHSYDVVLSCNSCYYLNDQFVFIDNLNEILRILDRGGLFAGSMLKSSHTVLSNGEKISNNVMQIRKNYQGNSTGERLAYFDSSRELKNFLSKYFNCIEIAELRDEYNGFNRHLFYFTAKKK